MNFDEIIDRKRTQNENVSKLFKEIGELNSQISIRRNELRKWLSEDMEHDIFKNAALFIETYCEEKNVSERDFDRLVGWRPNTAIEIVRIARLPTEAEIQKVCHAFNIPENSITWQIKED